MGFWSLFVASLYPVMKILLVTLVGLCLSLDRINILGPTARINLNRMVFYVFSPALVGAYLAKAVTWEVLVEMWFMPVNILITFMVGSALGWILLKITRAPPHYHGLIIGCCAAGNLGNLMFILIPAICDESSDLFGDSSTCTTSGDAYASLSMALGAVYIWSYVYIFIKAINDRTKRQEVATNDLDSVTRESNQIFGTFSREISEPLLLSEDLAGLEDRSCGVNIPDTKHEAYEKEEVKLFLFMKIKEKFSKFITTFNLKMIFAPSVIGAIIGFTIGVVSPFRKLLIGDSAPLRTIYSSASLIGQAAIPSTTLILGSNLLNGFKSSGLSPMILIGIMVVRYVALPGIGIAVVKGAHHLGWVGSDSLFQFVLLIQYAVPPAMSVGIITQLFEVGQSDCSVIMFWSYAMAVISLTLWSTLFLSLVS